MTDSAAGGVGMGSLDIQWQSRVWEEVDGGDESTNDPSPDNSLYMPTWRPTSCDRIHSICQVKIIKIVQEMNAIGTG